MDHICARLLNICRSRDSMTKKQKLIWIKPIPPCFDLTSEQMNQFQQIIKISNTITQNHGFKSFDRYFIWEYSRQELLIDNSHHFAREGKEMKKIYICYDVGFF